MQKLEMTEVYKENIMKWTEKKLAQEMIFFEKMIKRQRLKENAFTRHWKLKPWEILLSVYV